MSKKKRKRTNINNDELPLYWRIIILAIVVLGLLIIILGNPQNGIDRYPGDWFYQ